MSHFVMLVLGEDVEGQLAPFDENLEPPESEMEFEPIKEDNLEELKKSYESEQWSGRYEFGKWITSEDELAVKKPLQEIMSFDAWMQEEQDFVRRDDQYGYFNNPKAKWDWWVVGGRWDGFLLLKHKLCYPQDVEFADNDRLTANVARKVDIDFEGMEQNQISLELERWKTLKEIVAGEEFKSFNEILEKFGKDRIVEARAEYWSQPVIKRLQSSNMELLLIHENIKQAVSRTREEVIEYAKDLWLPFGFVYHGKWIEKAEMGWWAITVNEDDDYPQKAKKILAEQPDDILVTVVDCHV